MSIFNIFNKNKKNENKQLTIEEKWNIDVESYNNLNYKAKTGESKCYNCIYMNKSNIFKCPKVGDVSKEILKGEVKCDFRKEKNKNIDIKEIEDNLKIALPKDYVDYICTNDGITGVINNEYHDLWKLEDLVSRNKEYNVQEFFPNLIYFGSNGGDEAYAFDKSNNMCIVSIPFIGKEEDKKIIANNFNEFINDNSKK